MRKEDEQILIVNNIVNNNIVIAKDFYGREVIAIGKGLGFRKHKHEAIQSEEIIKTYVLVDKPSNGVFTLFEEVPFEVIEISQQIIDYAQDCLKEKFNANLLIGLADHINFSVNQYLQGHLSPQLVNEEVKRFYKEEYQVGQVAVKMINEEFDIVLPKEEAASIAFHLITSTENKSNHQTLKIMHAVSDIVRIVEQHLNITLDEDSPVYSRFIIHLKFFLRSVLSNQMIPSGIAFVSIFNQLKSEYTEAIDCVKSISGYIMKNFLYQCNDDDCIYLMIHIISLYKMKKP